MSAILLRAKHHSDIYGKFFIPMCLPFLVCSSQMECLIIMDNTRLNLLKFGNWKYNYVTNHIMSTTSSTSYFMSEEILSEVWGLHYYPFLSTTCFLLHRLQLDLWLLLELELRVWLLLYTSINLELRYVMICNRH